MLPERLQTGYRAFLDERFPRERSRYEALADRQRPEIMVIGCCDSRVSPEAIFDASPGELFVVRNVANLVPPYAPDGEYHGTSGRWNSRSRRSRFGTSWCSATPAAAASAPSPTTRSPSRPAISSASGR